MEKIAAALKPNGVAIFHEYINYAAWSVAPTCAGLVEFVREVMSSWRETGGEPDIAPALIGHLTETGFAVNVAVPRVFTARPGDPLWRWPASFFQVCLDRLIELKRVDPAWVNRVRAEFLAAEHNPNSVMITPLVLEIVARRMS